MIRVCKKDPDVPLVLDSKHVKFDGLTVEVDQLGEGCVLPNGQAFDRYPKRLCVAGIGWRLNHSEGHGGKVLLIYEEESK